MFCKGLDMVINQDNDSQVQDQMKQLVIKCRMITLFNKKYLFCSKVKGQRKDTKERYITISIISKKINFFIKELHV